MKALNLIHEIVDGQLTFREGGARRMSKKQSVKDATQDIVDLAVEKVINRQSQKIPDPKAPDQHFNFRYK